MSRITTSIKRINKELNKISGLDGIAADLVEMKEKEIKALVKHILEHHSEASIFNYYGIPEDNSEE